VPLACVAHIGCYFLHVNDLTVQVPIGPNGERTLCFENGKVFFSDVSPSKETVWTMHFELTSANAVIS
jgi:hypothetical protein